MGEQDVRELIGTLGFGRYPLGFGITDHNDLSPGPGCYLVGIGLG